MTEFINDYHLNKQGRDVFSALMLVVLSSVKLDTIIDRDKRESCRFLPFNFCLVWNFYNFDLVLTSEVLQHHILCRSRPLNKKINSQGLMEVLRHISQ